MRSWSGNMPDSVCTAMTAERHAVNDTVSCSQLSAEKEIKRERESENSNRCERISRNWRLQADSEPGAIRLQRMCAHTHTKNNWCDSAGALVLQQKHRVNPPQSLASVIPSLKGVHRITRRAEL